MVELMISAGLASFILAGVLSSFLFIGRSGANIQNYNDMESQARKCLEIFAEDVRQANTITWASATTLSLTVPNPSGTGTITVDYAYNSTSRIFVRRDPTGTRTLLTGITTFDFKAYTITGAEITNFSDAAARTVANNTTKQLQLSVSTSRTNRTVVDATNTVLSARFILRNKLVTA
jgi:Tfp pilus assembly protein PilW